MSQKTYRTARGKLVDMGKLLLRNEKTRAIGNMGVNARGDKIDSFNNVIETRSQIVSKKYKKQTNVSSGLVTDQPLAPVAPVVAAASAPQINSDTDITSGELLNVTPAPVAPTDDSTGGFAAAVKRAKKSESGESGE